MLGKFFLIILNQFLCSLNTTYFQKINRDYLQLVQRIMVPPAGDRITNILMLTHIIHTIVPILELANFSQIIHNAELLRAEN